MAALAQRLRNGSRQTYTRLRYGDSVGNFFRSNVDHGRTVAAVEMSKT
jgi:hypothetical protein